MVGEAKIFIKFGCEVCGVRTRTIDWDPDGNNVVLIDQTLLPEEFCLIGCDTVAELCEAIRSLRVRGAPALGAAGGFGVALAAFKSQAEDPESLKRDVREAAVRIKATRPTAVNLAWGVERVLSVVEAASSVAELRELALREAQAIADEDIKINQRIGENGAVLLEDGDTVLTHCNAGRLACVGWGTALGVIRSAVSQGKKLKVIACETRPLLQGSRLTSWELLQDGIPVTLITDSTAGYLMRQGKIDRIIVGADRITRDAVFNKIGTYTHSVLAKEHNIPFYVAAPISTFDLAHQEKDIEIELRSPSELKYLAGKKLAPDEVEVYNPAFDATPLENVTAIITEKGIHRPRFDRLANG